jgi:4,5-dihydroxyphthalate decarboxylase
MRKREFSIAIGNYDRVRPLIDGAVTIDGVEPIFLLLGPEEIFYRAFRRAEFDVCELSLSSFALKVATGDNPYVGIPVFPSRAFRHTSIYIRTDKGIRTPEDLKGRRIGTPEYQLTACVWARILLEDQYGARPADIRWVRGGLEHPGRIEKIAFDLPADISIETAPAGTTLSELLETGDIDGIISPRAPSCFERGDPKVAWLFSDPVARASDYFRRTGIFPIMHLIGIRRDLVDLHRWLPATIYQAFVTAKAKALASLEDTSASKVSLPFVEEGLRAARELMGNDYWSYGLEANRNVLDTFLRHHHAQGLSSRRLEADELFHGGSLDLPKI